MGDIIASGSFDGWAYLITAYSTNNEHCGEELGYALLRALDERGVGVIQFVLCFMLMIEVAALVQTVARSLLQQSIF